MFRVCILVGNGVEELDFIGVYEVLCDVRKVSSYGLDVKTVVYRGPDRVVCGNGLVILPHEIVDDFSRCDVLVIPGGRRFVEESFSNRELLDSIRRFYEEGGFIASVCTGSLILAKAGLLRGRKATTHHLRIDMLRELGAYPVRERIVVSDRIVTAAGISASVDLGLKLVEILCGVEISHRVREYIEYIGDGS